MEARRITIRIAPQLHRRLRQVAAERSLSLNTLAVRALEAYVALQAADQEQLPLREIAALLAPAGEAAGLTEEEVLQHARQVRRRIWQERYEQAVQLHADRSEAR